MFRKIFEISVPPSKPFNKKNKLQVGLTSDKNLVVGCVFFSLGFLLNKSPILPELEKDLTKFRTDSKKWMVFSYHMPENQLKKVCNCIGFRPDFPCQPFLLRRIFDDSNQHLFGACCFFQVGYMHIYILYTMTWHLIHLLCTQERNKCSSFQK